MNNNFTILVLPYGLIYDVSEDTVNDFDACREYNSQVLHHLVNSIPFHEMTDGIDYPYHVHTRAMIAFPVSIVACITGFITHALTGLTGDCIENRARVFNLFFERILYHPFTENGISFDDFIGKHFLEIPESLYTDQHYELIYELWLGSMLGELKEFTEDYGILGHATFIQKQEHSVDAVCSSCSGVISIVDSTSYHAYRDEHMRLLEKAELDDMYISDVVLNELSHDERIELHQFDEFLLD